MAFDGITVAALVSELKQKLVGGRILKISQPEREELLLTIKNYDQYKLFMSVGAGLPLVYLTENAKPAPLTAPNFCMLLRKHLNSAKILDIEQPGFERTIRFKIEHLNELGDSCVKYLIIEIMGKHSNIIFCDENLTILDAIRHVSGLVSSVREVLPGRSYFIPDKDSKKNPLEADRESFAKTVRERPMALSKAIYQSYTGISPLMANEICYRAGLEADRPANALSEAESLHLARFFEEITDSVKENRFEPQILLKDGAPSEFTVITLTSFETADKESQASTSAMLERYYSEKNAIACVRNHSSELRHLVSNFRERTVRKLELQEKQYSEAREADIYKVYGELLTAYGYGAEPGSKEITVTNYYDGQELTIPLDPSISAIENAKKYFDKYSKHRRTRKMLDELLPETRDELQYLDSVCNALEIAQGEGDLVQIREELTSCGYLKKKQISAKKQRAAGKHDTKPLHFVSSDGFDIYVGKNNIQNEELTFKFAEGGDWWFHAKGIPGSHVILKTNGREVPDRAFEEAAALAAKYSSAPGDGKTEVDYTLRKNVKKPNGARPGFVVYYTNYSIVAEGGKAL